MAKMLSPKTTIWWLDSDATFVPTAPTATALLADIGTGKAKNISAAIVAGYTLNPTDSDTDSTRTIVDASNAESRGAGNFEANLASYLEADPTTNTTSEYLIFFNLFKAKGKTGTLVRRYGYVNTVAPAAGHLVDIFSVVSDNPTWDEPDSGGGITMNVPFGSQGFFNMNEPLG